MREQGDSLRRTQQLHLAAWFVFALAVIGVLSELLAGPAYRLGWIGLRPGLQTIRWAASLEAGVFAVALAGAWLASRRQLHQARAVFILSSIIGLLAAAPPAALWYRVQQLPRIHDISTDTENPPEYVSIVPIRREAPNSITYDPGIAALQLQAYPDVKSVSLATPPDQAFQKALRIARDMGWEIVEANQSALRIEATDTTFLFGFKDDVVIRINADQRGSRVDLRSLSRVGVSDLGVNAHRIRKFIAQLDKEAEA